MVKSRPPAAAGGGASNPIAPFLLKCYDMVDDEANKAAVSWTESGDTFVIHDETDFTLRLLPQYWKHDNFSSFMRQLNIYGFRKVDTDRWEFSNDGFVRGQKHLLNTITRRKNIQAADQRRSMHQPEEAGNTGSGVENFDLWNEVQNLKIDKNALMQELVKLRQHQETADNKLLLLRERLKGMEINQQQMLSFLVMAMQNPGFFVQLLQPREKHGWRSPDIVKNANFSERVMEVTEANISSTEPPLPTDGTIVRYHRPAYTDCISPPSPLTKPLSPPELEIADGMTDFFMNSDLMKTLMDENCSVLDDQSPLIFPGLHDDGLLDNYFFGGEFLDNNNDATLETLDEKGVVKIPEMDPALESQIRQMNIAKDGE